MEYNVVLVKVNVANMEDDNDLVKQTVLQIWEIMLLMYKTLMFW